VKGLPLKLTPLGYEPLNTGLRRYNGMKAKLGLCLVGAALVDAYAWGSYKRLPLYPLALPRQ
jgi:hypothetical protein